MTTIKEIITAFEYRKHVADEKVKINYHPDKFKIISETYAEALNDLRRIKNE